MALLAWDNKYSVGVQALDSQHKVLFDILNELHAAMISGQARQVTGPLLHKLLEYTDKHFTAEENMLSASGYPALSTAIRKRINLTSGL